MRKNYPDNCHSIINKRDITMEQIFDISVRFVFEQDEIWSGDNLLGKSCMEKCLLSMIQESSIFNAQRSMSLQIPFFLDKSSKIHPSIERCIGTKIGMVVARYSSARMCVGM